MARKKQTLSVEQQRQYYRSKYEQDCQKLRPDTTYEDGTITAILRIQDMWIMYCEIVDIDYWFSLVGADVNVFENFLVWYLDRFTVKKVSSLVTYWRNLSQLYIHWREIRMEPLVLKQVEVLIYGELAQKYDLDLSESDKPILDVEDLLQVLYCLWVTDSNVFPHELFRLKLSAILLLAAYTGSRPAALLAITYDDIRVFVQRDREHPERTAHMMTLRLRFTKGRMKRTRVKTYTFNLDANPFLCIITQIIGIAFYDDAFDSLPGGPRLTCNDVFGLGVVEGLYCQEMPFKKEFKNKPIFRDPVCFVEGASVEKALPYSKYHPWIKRLGELTGFLQILTTYCLRRGTGNAVNDDPDSNDPNRNLIMDHANSAIFCRNYLSRQIRYDVMASYLGAESRTNWIRNAHSMSRSLDPRRPVKLTEEQKSAIRIEPEIQMLADRKDALSKQKRKRNHPGAASIEEEHRLAHNDYSAALRARERAVLAEARREYDAIAPLQDLQAQLLGSEKPVDNAEALLSPESSFPERIRLSNVFSEMKSFNDNETTRRVTALEDMVSLCSRRNLNTRRRRAQQIQQPRRVCVNKSNGDACQAMVKRTESTGHLEEVNPLDDCDQHPPLIGKANQCLECIGRIDLGMEDRFKVYGSKDSLRRHYDRVHIFKSDQPCPHPACGHGPLATKMHYMNHAATVHGITMSESTHWKLPKVL